MTQAKDPIPASESLDEAIYVRVRCRACGNVFEEYNLLPRTGDLISPNHPMNERPAASGWKRSGPRPDGVRGLLSGGSAYRLEQFEGKPYYRWRCGGKNQIGCSSRPKIAPAELVVRARRLASETSERPIELWL